MRRPAVARGLGFEPQSGLLEYLAGEVALGDAIVADEASGMDVLPAVAGAVSAPDLLGSQKMRTLLEKLKTDYDLVLVDSPPLLVVSDATVLGQLCDKLVFVVRWEQTAREAAEDAVHRMAQFEVEVAGVVLSRMDTRRVSEYGYGSQYAADASKYYVN